MLIGLLRSLTGRNSLRRGINIPIGDIEMKRNLFYYAQDGYEAVLDLDKATGMQRYNNRIVIHYGHPDESFVIYDDKEEFHIVNAYFQTLITNRLKLIDFTPVSRTEEREESIHQFKQQGD